MRHCTLVPAGLGTAMALALTATATFAGGVIPAGVPTTGWYPAEVIEKRGMDRYAEAWYLEPCINGGTSRSGAYATQEAEEVLKETMAGTDSDGGLRLWSPTAEGAGRGGLVE